MSHRAATRVEVAGLDTGWEVQILGRSIRIGRGVHVAVGSVSVAGGIDVDAVVSSGAGLW